MSQPSSLPGRRIKKHAGAASGPSYNARTAVDDTSHIIVTSEPSNNAANAILLLPMLNAVKDMPKDLSRQVSAP